MPHAAHDFTRSDRTPIFLFTAETGPSRKTIRRSCPWRWSLTAVMLATIGWAGAIDAQDWGESEDGWSEDSEPYRESNESSTSSTPVTTAWSLRAGVGFTIDPNTFLMNFEVPYRFDQYVSLGPMVQVGVEEQRLLVAPTANLTLTIPNLPGESLDRFHPNIFGGIGFAVIENDKRGGDKKSAGFLVNAGFGLDYQLSEHLSIGSRMIFNFLPERTLEQKFWYSWEVAGIRLAF